MSSFKLPSPRAFVKGNVRVDCLTLQRKASSRNLRFRFKYSCHGGGLRCWTGVRREHRGDWAAGRGIDGHVAASLQSSKPDPPATTPVAESDSSGQCCEQANRRTGVAFVAGVCAVVADARLRLNAPDGAIFLVRGAPGQAWRREPALDRFPLSGTVHRDAVAWRGRSSTACARRCRGAPKGFPAGTIPPPRIRTSPTSGRTRRHCRKLPRDHRLAVGLLSPARLGTQLGFGSSKESDIWTRFNLPYVP